MLLAALTLLVQSFLVGRLVIRVRILEHNFRYLHTTVERR